MCMFVYLFIASFNSLLNLYATLYLILYILASPLVQVGNACYKKLRTKHLLVAQQMDGNQTQSNQIYYAWVNAFTCVIHLSAKGNF